MYIISSSLWWYPKGIPCTEEQTETWSLYLYVVGFPAMLSSRDPWRAILHHMLRCGSIHGDSKITYHEYFHVSHSTLF